MVRKAEQECGLIKMRTDEQLCAPLPSHQSFNLTPRTIVTWNRGGGNNNSPSGPIFHDHINIILRVAALGWPQMRSLPHTTSWTSARLTRRTVCIVIVTTPRSSRSRGAISRDGLIARV